MSVEVGQMHVRGMFDFAEHASGRTFSRLPCKRCIARGDGGSGIAVSGTMMPAAMMGAVARAVVRSMMSAVLPAAMPMMSVCDQPGAHCNAKVSRPQNARSGVD